VMDTETGKRFWRLNVFYLDAWHNRFKAFDRRFVA